MRGAASLHGRRGIRQISNAHEKLPKDIVEPKGEVASGETFSTALRYL